MNIGIDLRALLTTHKTGVGEYTFELLNAVFKIDRENQYYLFYNSYADVVDLIPHWDYPNVHYVNSSWPNKIFNASLLLLQRPRLDKKVLEGKRKKEKLPFGVSSGRVQKNALDTWFAPNLNFTALSKKTKYILTIHDLSWEFLPECYSRKQRLWHQLVQPKKQCERADLILTPSENTKRDIVDCYGIKADKIKVIYPGLSSVISPPAGGLKLENSEAEKTRVRTKYNLPEKYILFLGTLEPRKNLTALLGAYEQGNFLADGYSLIIAGAVGWGGEKMVAKIKQVAGARYLGYVENVDKFGLYASASSFVYPSLYEGFGLPVVEAMACGCPVITSNRSSLPEVTKSAVYLVSPNNSAEIIMGMRMILADLGLRNYLVVKGQRRVQDFLWEYAAQVFMEGL